MGESGVPMVSPEKAPNTTRPAEFKVVDRTEADRHKSVTQTFLSSTAQNTCRTLGWVFLIFGFIGIMSPGFMGAHLTPVHNLIHLVSGAIALWAGRSRTMDARRVAVTLGVVYTLFGLVGFIAGVPGYPSVPNHGMDRFLLMPAPGMLELGTSDHVIHFMIGALFLIGAILSRRRSGTAGHNVSSLG